MDASRPTAILIRSARSGKRRGAPIGFIAFSDLARSFRPRTCSPSKLMSIRSLTALSPTDLSSWKVGPQNTLTIQNLVLGKIPILRRWAGPGENPQSGSGYTVKASGRDYGPSERFTADLSNLDASTLNIVTGQSGNFLSPYYMDQWNAWYTGYTFVLPFSKSAVEEAATHRLLLEPK